MLCIVINGQGRKQSNLLAREDDFTEFGLERSTTNLLQIINTHVVTPTNKNQLTKKPSISGLPARVLQLPPLTEPP